MYTKLLAPVGALLLALVATAFVLASADRVVAQIARAIAGILLVFVLPGFAVTAALFPEREPDIPVRLVWIAGTSLLIAVLGGFVLNGTSAGLTTTSWALLLCGITTAASLVGIWRRLASLRKQPLGARREQFEFKAYLRPLGLFGLAVLLTIGAVVIARDAASSAGPGFTQLWLVPTSDEPRSARLGFTNREAEPVTYRVQVRHRDQTLFESSDVQLADGETWEMSIPVPPDAAYPTEALLYRTDQPDTVYRSVTVWNIPSES